MNNFDPRLLWPAHFDIEREELPDTLIDAVGTRLLLSREVATYLCHLYIPLAAHLAERAENSAEPLLLGINGAQATGKSTAAEILVCLLWERHGLRSCSLSIDDIYLTRAERRDLAERIHPLLMTRGVPGTHDLTLARQLFAALRAAGPATETAIPRFDKAADDRLAPERGDTFVGRPDIVVFEGWCVGAVPQPETELERPCNNLEREEDAECRWRRYVNRRLEDYQSLFGQLDTLVMLRAPSFEQVFQWRSLQERKLRDSLGPEQLKTSRVMTDEQLRVFISHYERLTRWILSELPERADVVLQLNPQHRVDNITTRSY